MPTDPRLAEAFRIALDTPEPDAERAICFRAFEEAACATGQVLGVGRLL